MRENPYQVLGTGVATLRGRRDDWRKLLRHLEKPTPDHVSVVGPRYIGKTVLLNALAAHFAGGQSSFDACIYWDLRHGTPNDDVSFYEQFARQVAGPLRTVNEDAAAMLAASDGGTFETLDLVFKTLAEERRKVLVILDGLDAVLLVGSLSKNLWDNLRSLAELSSLRFVTGSRRRLRELCASPESRTSDFWNIFAPNPLSLHALKDDNWSEFLSPFEERNVSFHIGARTEFTNWSGGVPALASLLCRNLWEKVEACETVTNEHINQLANESFEEAQDLLQDLWEDCSEEEKGIIAELAHGHVWMMSDLPVQQRRMLVQRGFTREKGETLFCSCRFMKQYAEEHGARSTGLRKLFGAPEDFDTNVKGFLELRFGHLNNVDSDMSEYLKLAIQSVDKPSLVLLPIRGLVNRAFKLIWDSELSDGKIPEEWTESWKKPDKEGNRGEFDPPKGLIPSQGGRQCYLLNLLTDSRKAGTTKVSRATYFLLDHLQSIGDFGQHLQGEPVPLRFGTTVCFAAIQLCEQLAKELGV